MPKLPVRMPPLPPRMPKMDQNMVQQEIKVPRDLNQKSVPQEMKVPRDHLQGTTSWMIEKSDLPFEYQSRWSQPTVGR